MNDTRSKEASCARVRDRLERLLDGALPPLEEARDRGHLEACAACAREEERWRALLTAIGAASRPPTEELAAARPGLADRLASRPPPRPASRTCPRSPPRSGPWRDRLAPALVTAAAAVVALFALEFVGFGFDRLEILPREGLSQRVSEFLGDGAVSLPGWSRVKDGIRLEGGSSR